jgi:hypothetical protein
MYICLGYDEDLPKQVPIPSRVVFIPGIKLSSIRSFKRLPERAHISWKKDCSSQSLLPESLFMELKTLQLNDSFVSVSADSAMTLLEYTFLTSVIIIKKKNASLGVQLLLV